MFTITTTYALSAGRRVPAISPLPISYATRVGAGCCRYPVFGTSSCSSTRQFCLVLANKFLKLWSVFSLNRNYIL